MRKEWKNAWVCMLNRLERILTLDERGVDHHAFLLRGAHQGTHHHAIFASINTWTHPRTPSRRCFEWALPPGGGSSLAQTNTHFPPPTTFIGDLPTANTPAMGLPPQVNLARNTGILSMRVTSVMSRSAAGTAVELTERRRSTGWGCVQQSTKKWCSWKGKGGWGEGKGEDGGEEALDPVAHTYEALPRPTPTHSTPQGEPEGWGVWWGVVVVFEWDVELLPKVPSQHTKH